MKIRNSSRITALVLALMMIVPLISVPTFALNASENFDKSSAAGELIWSADFEDADSLSDVYSATGNRAELVDIGGDHGKVYKNTNAPSELFANVKYWVNYGGRDGTWKAVTNAVVAEDGTLSGTVTLDKEYTFSGAFINATKWNEKAMTIEGYSANTIYCITGSVRDALAGGYNIAKPNYVKMSDKNIKTATAGGELVFVADYYFSADYNRAMDIRLKTESGEWHFFGLESINASTLNVIPHGDLKNIGTAIQKYTVTVNKEEWVTLAAAINPTTGAYSLYANGDLVGYGTLNQRLFGDDITGGEGWNLGHPLRGGATTDYKGYWMVDNLRVYNGEVGEWTADAIYRRGYETATPYSTVINYSGPTTGSIEPHYNGHSIYANWVKSDDASQNGKIAGHGMYGAVDKNMIIKDTKKVTAADYNSLVFEADYYLSREANYQFESQFQNMIADFYGTNYGENMTEGNRTHTQASVGWVDLWQMNVVQSTGVATLYPIGGNLNDTTVTHATSVPTGQWVTISTVLDMDTGWTKIYLDGVLAVEYQMNRTNGYANNITVDTNKWIAAKLMKVANFSTIGNQGSILVDNVTIYQGTEPHCLETDDYVTYGGNDWLDNNGKAYTSSQYTTVSGKKPTITHNAAPDGTPALQFTLGLDPTTSKTVDFAYIAGPNSRVYKIDTTTTKMAEDFDPKSIATTEAGVTEIATKTGSGAGGTSSTDKIIYYALNHDGTKVYVWNTNFSYYGLLNVAQPIAEGANAGKYDSTEWYAGLGDNNIDVYVKPKTPEYTEETHGVVVYNATYYVDEAANGTVESQIQGSSAIYKGSDGKYLSTGFYNMYQLNLTHNTFYVVGAKVSADLTVNAWNRVTTVVDMLNDKVTFYLNGVYVAEQAYTHKFIPADGYIVAKCMKAWGTDAYNLTGNYWIGEFSSDAQDASNFTTVDASEIVAWNVDGFESVNKVAGDAKLYVEDSYSFTTAAEYYADYAAIVNTLNVASIRLSNPTGLRFATEMNTELLAALEADAANVAFGTLIAPMDDGIKGGGSDLSKLTHELEYVLDVKCADYYKDIDNNADTEHFVGSIVNINANNYNRAFSGRGYVAITLANGNVYYIYSASIKTISVVDQAQATKDNAEVWNAMTPTQQAAVEAFLAN